MDKKELEDICKEEFEYFMKGSNSVEDFENRKYLLNDIDIKDNEVIECVAPISSGNWGVTRNGLIVVTEKRVFVLFKKSLFGAEVSTLYFDSIISVDYTKTGLKNEVVISTNGDKELSFFSTTPDKLARVLQETLNEYRKGLNEKPEQKDDVIEQLERLFVLKNSGGISEDEYNLMKSNLMKKM